MDRRSGAIILRRRTFRFQPIVFSTQQVGHGTLAWIRWCWSPPPRYFRKSAHTARTAHIGVHCADSIIAYVTILHALTISFPEPFPKLFQNFGNFLETFGGREKRSKSKLHVDPLRPRPRLRDPRDPIPHTVLVLSTECPESYQH